MRLVDDEQAGVGRERGQHLVAEVGVVEPLRGDQQHVDRRRRRPARWISSHSSMLAELIVAARIAGPRGRRPPGCASAPAAARRSPWARDPVAPQQRGGDEVDRRLAPAGALHHQRPAPVDDQRLDRRPLVARAAGRRGRRAAQHLLGAIAQGHLVGSRLAHSQLVDSQLASALADVTARLVVDPLDGGAGRRHRDSVHPTPQPART